MKPPALQQANQRIDQLANNSEDQNADKNNRGIRVLLRFIDHKTDPGRRTYEFRNDKADPRYSQRQSDAKQDARQCPGNNQPREALIRLEFEHLAHFEPFTVHLANPS
ncbi:hypothetical protein BGX30_007590, partial [Mortierella sp. GBA39]